MMKLTDFDYRLPRCLIAQFPVKPRSSSRLLVLNREKQSVEHRHFYDLPLYINSSDTIVLNDTKVYPARLIGEIAENSKKVDLLLLKETGLHTFECLAKPLKYLREKDRILFDNGKLQAKVLSKGKFVLIEFSAGEKDGDLREIIRKAGLVPLPPYIKRQPFCEDRQDYQTVYARYEGAVAAPTAGLHFTRDILKRLREEGVDIAYLTLHTGYGTFAPVREEDIREHKMHKERFSIPIDCARLVNRARKNKKRVFAVGTTVCRTLESAVVRDRIESVDGETDLFVYPPYEFKIVDALVTNFHLPKTTLLMLVAAFCRTNSSDNNSGLKLLMEAYREAIDKRYRFYSYGDAMLII